MKERSWPPPPGGKTRRIAGVTPNVFFLGLVSLLNDMSSEMIFTLLPLFLSNVLGAATAVIGLIEGVAESSATLLRTFSGWLSDRVMRRKPIVVIGYGLSTLAKPFMYLAGSWVTVLGIRFADRVGKGLRTAPRDALISLSAPPTERGKSFGFHRALDTWGAVAGIGAATLVVYLFQRGDLDLVRGTYQKLVLVGIIPAVVGMLAFFFVREVKEKSPAPASGGVPVAQSRARIGTRLAPRFRILLLLVVVFSLGNSSDAFLLLRAQNLGASLLQILLMLLLFNAVYALSSAPAGTLSDRVGRKGMIVLGWLLYGLVYLGFALAPASWLGWMLFPIYGFYYGVSEGTTRALVADLVPAERRGTAYGLYHGAVGICLLPASILAGWMWQVWGPAVPFLWGAGMAFIATAGFVVLLR